MKRWSKGLLTVAVLLISTAVAQQDSFFPMGAMGGAYGWGGHDYLPDAAQLGSTWTQIDVGGMTPTAVHALCSEADSLGMKMILNSVGIDPSRPWLNLSWFASGQTYRYESGILCGGNDVGRPVPDQDASGDSAWLVTRGQDGWFQTNLTSDYLGGVWVGPDGIAYTAFFRLKVRDTPSDTSGAPVCSLVVTKQLGGTEELVAAKCLTLDSFTGNGVYDTFAIPFLKYQGEWNVYRYKIWFRGNVDSLWSDYVEYYDFKADSLLRYRPNGSPPPYDSIVNAIATEYQQQQIPVYRFYLADEADVDQYKCWNAVNGAILRNGINWNPNPSTYRRYVENVHPKEFWVDVYPLMGRTYPNQNTKPGGKRTPIDSGVAFQARLDTMCISLDSARLVAKQAPGGEIPLFVDAQAFGEYWTDSAYHFNIEWNTLYGPSPTPRDDESIWREPTSREFRCMSWLALAYGAKGLDYWLFPTNRCSWQWYPDPDSIKYVYLLGQMGWVDVDNAGCPGTHRPVFDTVRTFYDSTLKKIAPTLVKLHSDTVGQSSELPVGFISGCSDQLLQLGTFAGPRGRYFIVVNRHCLPTDFLTPFMTLNNLPPSPAESYYLLDEVSGEAIAPVSGSGTGPFRYSVHLAPGQGRLFRLVPFAGSLARNQGQSFSNLMQVALHPGYGDGTDQPVDSMRIYCQHSQPQDTVETDWSLTDSTSWIGYRADWVGRARLEGWNRFGARYRLRDGTNTPTYWSMPITIDTSLPHDSMNINHNAGFTTVPGCTLCSYASDVVSGPGQMQFTNDWLTNPALIADPGMTNPGYWACKNCELVDSLGLARMEIPANSGAYLYHRIPAESIQRYQDWQMMLSGDIVSDSFAGGAALQLQFCYVPDSVELGHDTVVVPQPLLPIEPGTVAHVSTYNYSIQFPFLPAPPANCHLWAVDVGVFAAPRATPGGRLWIDNLALELVFPEPAPNPSGWIPYQAELFPWFIGPTPGVHIAKAQYQDRAGNEGAWVADAIVLDNVPPYAAIGFPNWGQVITEAKVKVLGLAFDPPLPWDPTGSQLMQSHFKQYKLTWSQTANAGQDSAYGILPESLFYVPALPPEPGPVLPPCPWAYLATWNTKAITDQYGSNFYTLNLTVTDSAGNSSTAKVLVRLDTIAGNAGNGRGTGSGAMSLTTTPQNDLLVGTTNGLITQYTSELDPVQSMTIQDSTGPAVITGLATDSTGAIYVGDTRDRNVKVCDELGNPTDTIGNHTQLTAPNSVAIAKNGDVYVADRSRNVVRVYDGNNNLKLSFGSSGSDTGQFLGAHAIALSYTTAFDFQSSLDSSGIPVIETIATTLTRCLIADKGNHRIQVFDPTGHYLASFGDSILGQPVGLSVDTSGCCFVADQGNKAIYGFDPNGSLFLTIAGADTMTPIALTISTDNGSLYALDQNTHQLLKYLVCYTDTAEMGGGQSGAINPIKVPKELILEQSWPNPATRTLTIRYGIPRLTSINLKVYDISGKLVRTLETNDKVKPGYYNLNWNCRDNRDREIAGGVYFYRLVTSDNLQDSSRKPAARVKTRKLVIAK